MLSSSSYFEDIDLHLDESEMSPHRQNSPHLVDYINNDDKSPENIALNDAKLSQSKKNEFELDNDTKQKGEEENFDMSLSTSTVTPSFYFHNSDNYYNVDNTNTDITTTTKNNHDYQSDQDNSSTDLDETNTTTLLLGENNIQYQTTFKTKKNEQNLINASTGFSNRASNASNTVCSTPEVEPPFRQRSNTGSVRIGSVHFKNRTSLNTDSASLVNPLANIFNEKRLSFLERGLKGEIEKEDDGEENHFSNSHKNAFKRKKKKLYRSRSDYEMEILNSRKKVLDEELQYCYLDVINNHAYDGGVKGKDRNGNVARGEDESMMEISKSQSMKGKEMGESIENINKTSKIPTTSSTLIIRVGKSKRILDSLSLTMPQSKIEREQMALSMSSKETGPMIDQITTQNSEYDSILVKLEWYRLGPQTKGQFQPVLMSNDQPFGSYNCSADDVGCTICLRASVRTPQQFVPVTLLEVENVNEEGQMEGTKFVYKDDLDNLDNVGDIFLNYDNRQSPEEEKRQQEQEEEEEKKIRERWENENLRRHFREKSDAEFFYNQDEVAEILKSKRQHDDDNNDLIACRTAFIEIGPILVEKNLEKIYMEKMSIFSSVMEENQTNSVIHSSLTKVSQNRVLVFTELMNPFVPRMYYDLELYDENLLLYQYPLSNSIYQNSNTSTEKRRTLVTRGRYVSFKSSSPVSHEENNFDNIISCISLLSSSLMKKYYEIASNDTHPQHERLEVGQGKKIQTLLEQGILSEGFLLQILPEKKYQNKREDPRLQQGMKRVANNSNMFEYYLLTPSIPNSKTTKPSYTKSLQNSSKARNLTSTIIYCFRALRELQIQKSVDRNQIVSSIKSSSIDDAAAIEASMTQEANSPYLGFQKNKHHHSIPSLSNSMLSATGSSSHYSNTFSDKHNASSSFSNHTRGGSGLWKVYRDSVRDSLRESFSNLGLSLSTASDGQLDHSLKSKEEIPQYERKLVDSLPILEHLGDKSKLNKDTEEHINIDENNQTLPYNEMIKENKHVLPSQRSRMCMDRNLDTIKDLDLKIINITTEESNKCQVNIDDKSKDEKESDEKTSIVENEKILLRQNLDLEHKVKELHQQLTTTRFQLLQAEEKIDSINQGEKKLLIDLEKWRGNSNHLAKLLSSSNEMIDVLKSKNATNEAAISIHRSDLDNLFQKMETKEEEMRKDRNLFIASLAEKDQKIEELEEKEYNATKCLHQSTSKYEVTIQEQRQMYNKKIASQEEEIRQMKAAWEKERKELEGKNEVEWKEKIDTLRSQILTENAIEIERGKQIIKEQILSLEGEVEKLKQANSQFSNEKIILINDDTKQEMESTIKKLTQDKLLLKKKVDSLAREVKSFQREMKTRLPTEQYLHSSQKKSINDIEKRLDENTEVEGKNVTRSPIVENKNDHSLLTSTVEEPPTLSSAISTSSADEESNNVKEGLDYSSIDLIPEDTNTVMLTSSSSSSSLSTSVKSLFPFRRRKSSVDRMEEQICQFQELINHLSMTVREKELEVSGLNKENDKLRGLLGDKIGGINHLDSDGEDTDDEED